MFVSSSFFLVLQTVVWCADLNNARLDNGVVHVDDTI